jgi:hypothetical protein
MSPRFTQIARTAMVAVLLSMSPAQSGSRAAAPQNCDYGPNRTPGPGALADPNSDFAVNNGAGRSANDFVFSNKDGPNCRPVSNGYICPRSTNDARSSGNGQRQSCDGNICTYPCRNGDGYCADNCPSRGTQDGSNNHWPPRGQSGGNDGNNHHGGGDGGLLPWIFGGIVAVAGTAIIADQLTGKEWVDSKELDAHGPRFPIEQRIGRFQVQGYAASNWPFALDLYSEPGTRTWLEVRFKGDNQSQSVDLTRPEGGRRVALVQLPPANGGVRVARYSIHSVLERPGQEPLYRPIMVYGIGAGPGAVGALDSAQNLPNTDGARQILVRRSTFAAPGFPLVKAAMAVPARLGASLGASGMAALVQPAPRFGSYLSVTNFGPQYPSRPSDVSWSVSARQSFQRSELDVLQLPREGEGKLIEVVRADLDLFARPQASGSWGAVPVLAGVSPGTYQLQARAWRPKAGGGDWTGAFAPGYVYIR